MKFVLAFLLLIGISCQIGRGDCAPAETIIGSIAEKVSNGVKYVGDTISGYLPDNLPSVHVPKVMEDGYDSVKSGLGGIAEGAEEIAKDTIHDIADAVD